MTERAEEGAFLIAWYRPDFFSCVHIRRAISSGLCKDHDELTALFKRSTRLHVQFHSSNTGMVRQRCDMTGVVIARLCCEPQSGDIVTDLQKLEATEELPEANFERYARLRGDLSILVVHVETN